MVEVVGGGELGGGVRCGGVEMGGGVDFGERVVRVRFLLCNGVMGGGDVCCGGLKLLVV